MKYTPIKINKNKQYNLDFQTNIRTDYGLANSFTVLCVLQKAICFLYENEFFYCFILKLGMGARNDVLLYVVFISFLMIQVIFHMSEFENLLFLTT